MNHCEQARAQMTFYLDDELQDTERAALEAHLAECVTCREGFDRERRFLESLRGARPLHAAPPALRARVEDLLSDAPSPHTAPPELRERVERMLGRFHLAGRRPIPMRRLVARAAIVFVALLLGLWAWSETGKRPRATPPSDFALMAVDTHQRHLRGQLPLEITTAMPGQVSDWFKGKVAFGVELPNYQEQSGQEKLYELEGARLVGYQNDYAAYVAYRMQERPISLLVTSEQTARASGGEEIVSQNITFHYDSINGFKVLTWSDRGLTYGLVSDLEERGQQSCVVCHQGTLDRDFSRGLKP
ncbi:MAG TPA: zf-HC2 domain-containing protein [Blastocatellia bacterium]|nr:zf-HC2 domain-containing protein [Blastocatellia bacterium]